MKHEVSEKALAELSEQLKRMEKQTKEEIPKLARKAVLQEKAERLNNMLSETYLQWKSTQDEIVGLPTSALVS